MRLTQDEYDDLQRRLARAQRGLSTAMASLYATPLESGSSRVEPQPFMPLASAPPSTERTVSEFWPAFWKSFWWWLLAVAASWQVGILIGNIIGFIVYLFQMRVFG